MPKTMPNLAFKAMARIAMPIRNIFLPPKPMLAEVEIGSGYQVLDFGCGPGAFTLLAAEKVGPSGMVHALDVHPLAIEMLQRKAERAGISNIKTILSGCHTSLPDGSVDLVILVDVFHMLDNKGEVLAELHRVLKPDRRLCFSDHHMREDDFLPLFTARGLFRLESKGKRTHTFCKS